VVLVLIIYTDDPGLAVRALSYLPPWTVSVAEESFRGGDDAAGSVVLVERPTGASRSAVMALFSSRDHLLLPWRSRRTGHCELFTLIAVQTERVLRCGRESP